MKRIILLNLFLFSTSIQAAEYCISEKIEIKGTIHHARISNSDDYELEQLGKYTHILHVKHPTNQDVELTIDEAKSFKFIPQTNCEDSPLEV